MAQISRPSGISFSTASQKDVSVVMLVAVHRHQRNQGPRGGSSHVRMRRR